MSGPDARRHRILLVDDDPGLLRLLTIRLKSEGYEVAACESAAQAQASVPRFRPEVVVTDLRMAEKDGIGLLKDLQRKYPALPVILMTAHGTIPDAVEATQSGAFAFLTKPVEREDLLEKVERALRVSGFAAPAEDWRAAIVTRSPALEDRLADAQMAARTDSSILLSGPAGVGKRLFATAIHKASPRSAGPLSIIPCSTVSAERLESEIGRDALAGTVVLAEVADLSGPSREALVQLLARPTDRRARILSTTARDLKSFVARNEFSSDLFFQLATLQIDLPPLAQRREDIPVLAAHAIDLIVARTGAPRVLAPEAVELLATAEYPGNVQQLLSVIEQAASLAVGPVVSAEAIHRALGSGVARVPSFDEAREDFTRNYLTQLLNITRGNVTQAARLAGRNRTDFYKLLGRHEISPETFKS